jgi:hypothetical protein
MVPPGNAKRSFPWASGCTCENNCFAFAIKGEQKGFSWQE